jgi:[citrate (pro-3S)-lyase] ligase
MESCLTTCYGYPFSGTSLEKLRAFLGGCGLAYDEGVEFTVLVTAGGRIFGTGSLDGNVLKCIAVSAEAQGAGVAAVVVSELVKYAVGKGRGHLFLFTKPENAELFASLGFFAISATEKALLMENRRGGIADFVKTVPVPRDVGGGEKVPVPAGVIGAIVANCNPCTRGHQYLFETAAGQCERVYVFILSEEKSLFPADFRRYLVEVAVGHLPNVVVAPTGPYLISAATFPDYFLRKDDPTVTATDVNAELDLRIFAEHFAAPLGITRRFVGTEPFSAVTAAYNRVMHRVLPPLGVEVVEVARKTDEAGEAISASRVRELIAGGDVAGALALVPEAVKAHWENYVQTGRFQ